MASNHRLMKEIHDQFLVCKICYDVYTDPKTLTCLHSYCLGCLQKHVDSSRNLSQRVYSRFVACPLCRVKTEIPSGGLRKLPDNFLLSNLTEVLHKKSGRGSQNCEICPTLKSRHNKARSKCIECSKILCASCIELHLNTNVTRNHSLVDLRGGEDVQCKSHCEEIVRFYCEPCETCICVVCTFTDHKDHEISAFNEVIPKHRNSLLEYLNGCTKRLEELKSIVGAMKNYEQSLLTAKDKIRDCAIGNIRSIRQTERKLMQEIDDMLMKPEILSFVKHKDWWQNNLDTLQSTCDITRMLTQDGNVAMLILRKDIKGRLTDLSKSDLPNVPDCARHTTKFVSGTVELGRLQTTNGNEIDTGAHITVINACECRKDNCCRKLDKPQIDESTMTISLPHTNSACNMRTKRCQTEKCLQFDAQVQVSPTHDDACTNTASKEFHDQASQIMPTTVCKSTTAKPRTFAAETNTLDLSSLHPLLSSKVTLQNDTETFQTENRARRISNKGMQTDDLVSTLMCDQFIQTDLNIADDIFIEPVAFPNEIDMFNRPVFGEVLSRQYSSSSSEYVPESRTFVSDMACDPIFVEGNCASKTYCLDQETMTTNPALTDNSTTTDIVHYVDSAVTTDPTFTRNTGTATSILHTLDQFTNTDVVELKDAETDVAVETEERDTLTDKSVCLSTGTGTDYRALHDSCTWMESEIMVDSMTSMDNRLSTDRFRNFLSDDEYDDIKGTIAGKISSIEVQCDMQVNVIDKSTSTDSLVYLGLAGEFDKLDVMYPQWNCGHDAISLTTTCSELSEDLEHVVTIDQEISTDDFFVSDTSTQTQLTSSRQRIDSNGSLFDDFRLYDSPELKEDYEPRSIRASWYSMDNSVFEFDRITNPDCVDRSTNTARMSWRCPTPPHETADKSTSTKTVELTDKFTMTTCIGIKDERLAECITKLKHVKETLSRQESSGVDCRERGDQRQCNVVTEVVKRERRSDLRDQKYEQRYSADLTNDERKILLEDMLRETYSVHTTSDNKIDDTPQRGRKPQPITTLKPLIPETTKEKSNSLPKPSRETNTGVRMGRHAVQTKRMSRNHSAPGRISEAESTRGKANSGILPGREEPIFLNVTNEKCERGFSVSPMGSLPAITEITPPSSHMSDEVFMGSTDSSLSSMDIADNNSLSQSNSSLSKRSGSKSFVHRLLSRKKKGKKESKSVPTVKFNKDDIKPAPEAIEKVHKKPSSFVYVRQRLLGVHHDSREDS